jgi:hypothetical protein
VWSRKERTFVSVVRALARARAERESYQMARAGIPWVAAKEAVR